ncbi:MAG: hypothetical protein PHI36_05770 [Bacteroidales bacterium]|nr:hypothetical protein [Bacteroidales bacterium]
MIRYLLLCVFAIGMFSCQGPERQGYIAVGETDTISGNNELLNPNNPFRMRDSIKHYAIIPNISLQGKLKIFNSLQDSLQKEIYSENEKKLVEVEMYNYLIIKHLTDLIENHQISPKRLARKNIKYIQSADGKIGVLSWNENTGSAFQSFINILTYRTKNNKYKTLHLEWINQDFEYTPYAGEIKQIRWLGKQDNKNIYILFSRGIGCSDCLNEAFIGLSLQNDTIDMDYPLFVNENDLLVDTKNENLLQFEYNPLSKEIELCLVRDTIVDGNIITLDTLIQKWKFDGIYFQVSEEEVDAQ